MMASLTSQPAEKLHIYWTAKLTKDTTLLSFPNKSRLTSDAITRVNAIARQIQAQDFIVHQPPHPSICRACGLLTLCRRDGTLKRADHT